MRAGLASLVVAYVLMSAGSARGAGARLIYIRGTGANECADEAALRHAVRARIGYDPFFPWAKRAVVVSVATRGLRLVARVELVGEEGRSEGAREVTASGLDCGPLFDTLALTISIAIDPHALSAPTAPAGPATPTPEPPPTAAGPVTTTPPNEAQATVTSPEPPIASPTLPSAPRARPQLEIGAGVRSAFGTEPAVAPGIAIGAAIAWRVASLGLEIAADLPREAGVPAGGVVRAWLATASVLPCYRFAFGRVCGLASLGRFEGWGEGVSLPETRTAAYIAVGARAAFELPIYAHLVGTLHADLAYNARPATLRVGGDDVWNASRVPGALALGVASTF